MTIHRLRLMAAIIIGLGLLNNSGAVAHQLQPAATHYPLTTNTFVQLATLTDANGAANDRLGNVVAMTPDGSTIVVGVPDVNSNRGAVYVFAKSSNWTTTSTPTAILTNTNGIASDELGLSVAISADGSTVVAGSVAGGGKGAVYVFVKAGSNWTSTSTPDAILTNASGGLVDQLGYSVSTNSDGSTIVAGADQANGTKGAAYIFTRSGANWANTSVPTAVLSNSSSAVGDYMGISVAMSADGSTVVVGAALLGNNNKGAAYVFVKSGTWATTSTPTAALTNSGSTAGDELGRSVSTNSDGSTVVTGAPGVNSAQGTAYVFVKSGTWATTSTPTAALTNSTGATGDVMGTSVFISSDDSTIIAGAPGANSGRGAAYVFGKSGTWATTSTPAATLTNSSGAVGDELGNSVSTNSDGSIIVAGAPLTTVNSHTYQGAVYVFGPGYRLYLPLIMR